MYDYHQVASECIEAQRRKRTEKEKLVKFKTVVLDQLS